MERPRSKSPPKTNTATAPTSSPRTSPRKRDEAKEERKEEGGDTTTKAAATVPTLPRVTRSQATIEAKKNTKGGDNADQKDANDNRTENDNDKIITDGKSLSVAGDDNKSQSDCLNEGNDKQDKEPKRKTTRDPKSKATSAAKTIHNETEPKIDGSEKSGDELSLSSNASRKTKVFNAGKLHIILSCSYFDSNKCSFYADKMRKFPKELVEKVR